MNASRFPLLLLIMAAFVLPRIQAAARAEAPPNQPTEPARLNVLFLIADDLNRAWPAYGASHVQAPNLDRLASRGVRFGRAYCQCPVCSPSRVSFLSGKRPEQTGMYGNEGPSRTPLLQNSVFLPEHFRQHGYFTARVGKVFHIGRDVPECWDVSEEGTPENRIIYQPSEVEKLGLEDKVTATGLLEGGGGEGNNWSILDVPDDSLIDGRIAARTVQLIDQAARGDKPFFIACGFRRPHLPRMAPASYFNKYALDAISLPTPSPVTMPGIKGPVSEQDTREALRSYYACISFMDAQLGKVLDALDRHDLSKNTVVVLIGDHGYQLGSRGGWWGKGTLYDESDATTLLISAPGARSGSACPRVVEFIDLYPTLVDLAGLPARNELEGHSLRPLIESPNAPWNHPAFTMTARDGQPLGLAVSTARYRLLVPGNNRPSELYDYHNDPQEFVNLIDDPAHTSARKELQTLAEDYFSRYRSP